MKDIKEIKKRMDGKNLEVFFVSLADQTPDSVYWDNDDNEPMGEGWFYWYCQPGCLPDGDPVGPFMTEDLAYMDADSQDFEEEEDQEDEEIEEEVEEKEIEEPIDGDYMIQPSGPLGTETTVSIVNGKILGVFKNDDVTAAWEKAYAAIREDMKKNNCYPSVWDVSDHGNISPVTDLWGEGGKDE